MCIVCPVPTQYHSFNKRGTGADFKAAIDRLASQKVCIAGPDGRLTIGRSLRLQTKMDDSSMSLSDYKVDAFI